MAYNDRLKEARKAIGFTQEQLANKIGVAKSTVTGYEKGNSEPSMLVMKKIMDSLCVDANYLWQDELKSQTNEYTQTEKDHIKKYRTLCENDKKAVDNLIDTLCDKFPFGYEERINCFTDADGARSYLKENKIQTPASFSGNPLCDDDICEIATKAYKSK